MRNEYFVIVNISWLSRVVRLCLHPSVPQENKYKILFNMLLYFTHMTLHSDRDVKSCIMVMLGKQWLEIMIAAMMTTILWSYHRYPYYIKTIIIFIILKVICWLIKGFPHATFVNCQLYIIETKFITLDRCLLLWSLSVFSVIWLRPYFIWEDISDS